MNYMLVINILFGASELSASLLLFYRQIMTLARSYDWLKGVLPLALGWHKYAVIRYPLDPSYWKIAHDYQVSYCNDVRIRSSQLVGGTKRQRSSSPSSRKKMKTPNNEDSICEGFNKEGCKRKHLAGTTDLSHIAYYVLNLLFLVLVFFRVKMRFFFLRQSLL